MEKFISLDIESPSKNPLEIVALAAHLYSNDIPTKSIILKRPIQESRVPWFNENILPKIQILENNCEDASEIYSKFLKFYKQNNSPDLVTYCSDPYEQFIINYLEESLKTHIPHFDIYAEFPNRFPEFENLEKFLLEHNKLPQKQSRHNPIYDAKITGETFICLKKLHLFQDINP